VASIKRTAAGIRIRFEAEERMILSGFAREVAQMLGGVPAADPDPLAAIVGMTADAEAPPPPEDPALRRLLPDAYDDPAGAAEFRRLTDDELRRGKATALSRLADDVEEARDGVVLDEPAADSWVQAVNDIRLVLGVRLGITDDDGSWRRSLSPDDPRAPLVAAYDWLSGLQELLLDELLTG
jgi:hypothetical protein